MAYWMHVDWDWIKQRPHFLAEKLSSTYDVTVLYPRSFHPKKNLVLNTSDVRHKMRIIRLPLIFYLFPLFKEFCAFINRIISSGVMKDSDTVWLTHPLFMASFTDNYAPEKKVIYDCMDDYLEFMNVKKWPALLHYIGKMELRLCRRADLIFVSSAYLAKKLLMRAQKKGLDISEKLHIVNNGINIYKNIGMPPAKSSTTKQADSIKHIIYIGTISEWIDFEVIIKALDNIPDVVFDFYGPITPGVQFPVHTSMQYKGVLQHKDIFTVMDDSDALIMPFKLNELILSVNPVKLYEYVYSGKPVIAIEYPETLPFEPFVYLYSDLESLRFLIRMVSEGKLQPKSTSAKIHEFISDNTWEKRAEYIDAAIRK
jgi:glycosyltransferase involved in cell wall biosynthesis